MQECGERERVREREWGERCGEREGLRVGRERVRDWRERGAEKGRKSRLEEEGVKVEKRGCESGESEGEVVRVGRERKRE